MIEDALELMLAGMGTVFVFLTLLVFATAGMSRLARKLTSASDDEGVSDEELAAISAAIARHRGDA